MARRPAMITTLVLLFLLAPPASGQTGERSNFLPIQMTDDGRNSSVVVKPGDHLWKISAKHLQEVLDRPPRSGEVAPYWADVIDNNREHLRSGNPDLIFPGEVVQLPDPISG